MAGSDQASAGKSLVSEKVDETCEEFQEFMGSAKPMSPADEQSV